MNDLPKYRQELIKGLEALDFDQIHKAADVIYGAWQRGNSVYIFGNGHSASTSEAFAADLRKWPQTENHRGVKAHALTLLPLMTAYANDVSYRRVFVEQLLDIIVDGDVAIGITCGGSENIRLALGHPDIKANCIRIGIVGVVSQFLFPVDILIQCRAPDIRQQEDIMSAVCHMICGEVKARIVHFPSESEMNIMEKRFSGAVVFGLEEADLLEAVVEAAKHYVAAGYAKPCESWRQTLMDALGALDAHREDKEKNDVEYKA